MTKSILDQSYLNKPWQTIIDLIHCLHYPTIHYGRHQREEEDRKKLVNFL